MKLGKREQESYSSYSHEYSIRIDQNSGSKSQIDNFQIYEQAQFLKMGKSQLFTFLKSGNQKELSNIFQLRREEEYSSHSSLWIPEHPQHNKNQNQSIFLNFFKESEESSQHEKTVKKKNEMNVNLGEESLSDQQKQKSKSQQVRKAEKLGSSYYNQELRKIIKKHFRHSRAQAIMKNWHQCYKSRKYFFCMIHFFNDKQRQNFMCLFEEALKTRLQSEKKKRADSDEKYFIKEIQDEFICIIDAAQIFFNGDYKLAIRKAFQRKRQHLHSTTQKGIKKAIEQYESYIQNQENKSFELRIFGQKGQKPIKS